MNSTTTTSTPTEAGDIEKQDDRQRLTFLPDERPIRQDGGQYGRRLSRSQSRRDSISNVRERAQSVSGVPIGYRTLSFSIANSQAKDEHQQTKKHHHLPHLGRDTLGMGKKNKKDKDTKKDEQVKESLDSEHFEKLDCHILDKPAVLKSFETSESGLTTNDAASRLARDGKNALPRRRENYFKKLFWYVFGGFCSVLWVGVIIFFICWRPLGDPDPQAYNLGLAILVLIVIFLQASFSAFQDWSTSKTMNAILDLLPAEAVVVRNGQTTKTSSSDLVVGDIVKLTIGNKTPADMRLLSTSGDLRFDRSMLTGESDEIDGAVDNTDKNFLESRNIALMGTMITNGSATGVVVLTGGNTCMGRISAAMSGVKEAPTLIQQEITRFVRIIVGLTVVLAALILCTWAGWLRKDHFAFINTVAMLNDVMGCVVAFIPEGMPVCVALTLMTIAAKMKASSILPKGLSTVETLGCVNVICSDKTGTLTENKMIVTSVGFVDDRLTGEEATNHLRGGQHQALKQLHRAAVLCNDASFDPLSMDAPVMDRETQGNATDGAILKFAEFAQSNSTRDMPDASPRSHQIPFNSKNKYMVTMHEDESRDKSTFKMYVKGAPDILLPKCTTYWSSKEGQIKNLDASARSNFSALQERLSRNAERVLLLCERTYHPTSTLGTNAFGEEVMESGLAELTIIGVFGITDPPRQETASTVAACRGAGIRFFMVTGDFGLTGAAIARNVGIFTHGEPDTYDSMFNRSSSSEDNDNYHEKESSSHTSLLLEGKDIAKLSDEDWNIVCAYEECVFARTTPEQKLRIVNELRNRENVVAVTGDGVNDAPALRAADVGVAVAAGSDVALEAADLVLLDKFDSIVEAIRLGRLVFQNLQKGIGYLLPAGSWSEIWPVLLNVFLGVPLPLSSFLMIIICVFTDCLCSLSLIMEKEEFDLLSLPPRDAKKDHLINLKIYAQSYLFIGVMETICAHAMFFLYMWKYAGIPINELFLCFENYSEGFHGYTTEQLTEFNTTGQCVYFVTLVIMQWGNLFSIRNKRMSILQADPFTAKRRNPYLLGGIVASLVIAVFVTMEPGIQSIFGTATVPIEFWLIPLPLAVGVLIMDELRKLAVRTWPKGPIARIAW